MENFNCSYSKIENIECLIENPKNPNKHPEKQIELLAKIINYQGQRSPIVVSKRSGFVVKGHGRLMALRLLGWNKVAVDEQNYESEAQEYADVVADNKIAELANHDDTLMIDTMKELDLSDDFDLDLFGIPDFNLETHDAWDADIESIDKITEPEDKTIHIYKISCPIDLKDEVLFYLKEKLMETSFEGVHIE